MALALTARPVAKVTRAPVRRRMTLQALLRPAEGAAARAAPRLGSTIASASLCLTLLSQSPALAAADEEKRLCDTACTADLEKVELVTLPSGLQYKDIVVGSGATPEIGFQARSRHGESGHSKTRPGSFVTRH